MRNLQQKVQVTTRAIKNTEKRTTPKRKKQTVARTVTRKSNERYKSRVYTTGIV